MLIISCSKFQYQYNTVSHTNILYITPFFSLSLFFVAPAIKVIDLDYDSKNPLKIIGQQTKTIFLSCRIESSEEFTWKWKHDGEEINTPPPYIIPWKFGSVLMVRPLLKGVTDGKYDCIAKNRYLTIVGTVDISVEKGNTV